MKKLYALLAKLTITNIAVSVICLNTQAQTTLAAGDLAIIGCNRLAASNPFELAIVALRDIDANTEIYICDFPYSNTSEGFVNTTNTSEGAIKWTTNAIAKGTVFLVKISATTTTPAVSGLPGSTAVTGWTSGSTTSTPVPAGGDNWFIYQGTSATAPTTFVFGWTNYSATTTGSANGWVANGAQVSTNTNTSELPPGLTNGSTARSLAWNTANGGSHGDNNVYKGTLSGTKAQLLAAICTVANWTTSETDTYKLTSASNGTTLNSGSAYYSSFTVNVPNTAPTATSVTSTGTLQVGQTLTGNYTYSDAEGNPESGSTFKWYRSDNASGLNKEAIGSAIAKTYMLVSADMGKYISFEVTPSDGVLNGTAVESPLRGPVTDPVLPVSLVDFRVQIEGNYVKLVWQTASETNNKGFEIYRSGDDKQFVKIGDENVDKDNYPSLRTYAFTDKKPLNGNNYYKLVQIDKDGKATELGVRTVSFNLMPSTFSLSPNPTKDKVTVQFETGKFGLVILSNTEGKVLRKLSLKPHEKNVEVDLTPYPSGIYFVRLQGNDDSITHKVIKQ